MNLSARTYLVIALICLLGIVQQWSGADTAWWRYGAALLALSLGYEWVRARTVVLHARIDNHQALRLGKAETLALRFHNASARNVVFQFAPVLPATFTSSDHTRLITLRQETGTVQPIDLVPQEMGEFSWHKFPIQVQGPLGLGWWSHSIIMDLKLTVVPDLAGARGRALGDVQMGMQAARVGTGQELHHLRKYVPGDPLHTVDWKATARTQNLTTRVFSEDQHLEIMVVLDVGRTSRTHIDGLSQFAHYINLTAKFAEHAVTQGDEIGLIAIADRPLAALPPRSGKRAVTDIRNALQKLRPAAVETDLLSAGLRVQRLVKRRSLVILLTDFYGQSLTGGLGQSLKLWQVRHLPMVVGLVGEDVVDLASQRAVSNASAFSSLAAEAYRTNLSRNATGAQRLGAHTIVSRPEDVQSRVLTQYQLLKSQRRV